MDNTSYYVGLGPDIVHYTELGQGSALESGQPNVEQFDDEQEAKSRAEELGYIFTIEEDPLDELET
ncbi:MAG: hypothetical protein CBC48_17430 [bacterium TMED88]|nr:MAG: hypothetical protein CBC48_17430 [bacterium TMED88]